MANRLHGLVDVKLKFLLSEEDRIINPINLDYDQSDECGGDQNGEYLDVSFLQRSVVVGNVTKPDI